MTYGPKKLRLRLGLRKWYHQNPEQHWDEFQQRYIAELAEQEEALQALCELAQQQKITLVTAAKDEQHNHVVVLKRVMLQRLAQSN